MASKARDLSNFISTAAIDASEIGTGAITTDKIADTTITHAKLHTTMDLSGKTVTLPTINALDVTNNINVGGTVDGVDIQALNTAVIANTAKVTNSTSASDLTSGTLPDARFPSTLPALNGSALTNLPAAAIVAVTDFSLLLLFLSLLLCMVYQYRKSHYIMYRIVASRNTCYYSRNQIFNGLY